MHFSYFDFKNKENTTKLIKAVLIVGSVCASIVAIIFGYSWYTTLSALNAKSHTLRLLANYDTTSFPQDKYLKDLYPTWKTIDDMVQSLEEINLEKERYQTYFETLQYPYKHFTQYLLLPPLNIWKNVYTQEVDITLIGPKFLEKNPYTKMAMIDKWSNFFKDVGDSSQFNEITDINIGDIQTDTTYGSGIFRIPITLSFTSPNKRSFLLLVEKLSITSNKTNIALLNEFVYNLREEIKKQKKNKIENFSYPGVLKNEKDINRKIGYILYSSLFDPDYNKDELLTENIIEETIKKSANCQVAKTEKCYYLFRTKYRSLPYLAYTVGVGGVDKIVALKNFFRNIPPLIQIKEFTFDKSRRADFFQQGNFYEGKISIDIIGRDIPDTDVEEIAKLLGKTCFQEDANMSVDKALEKITKFAAELSHLTTDNVAKGQELIDLKTIVEEIKAKYNSLSNYNKIIKLFELYRMLYDTSVCGV